MDGLALAPIMKRVQAWLDLNGAGPSLDRRHYSTPPFGNAYVTIDTMAQDEHASMNRNRIYLCGREHGLTREGLEELCSLHKAQGIPRFFVWLLPGEGADEVRAWLAEMGYVKNPWVRYITLALEGTATTTTAQTDLLIREASPRLIAERRDKLKDLILWHYYSNTAGKPGFWHWMAFDGGEPVAIASLGITEGVGYLATANTLEVHRKRGAQSALIAARIAKAREQGCELVVSETMNILKSSLGNLERAGLKEVYEREVFGLPTAS